MKIPSFVWIILLVVVGFGFVAFLANNKTSQTVSNATLPVEVDVYIDYNCPHCADFEPYVKLAKEKYGDKADIRIKNLPFLTSGQTPDTSVQYALAHFAARNQGKGDEYSEQLFKWISYLRSPANTTFTYTEEEKVFFNSQIDVDRLAEFMELDVEQFAADRVSEATQAAMKEEKDAAIKIMGAPSTPSIFFYGNLFKLTTYDDFDAKIDSYIKQAEANQSNL